MSYVTQAQLIERYGDRMLIQLSDRSTPPLGVADAVVIARAIADTDAAIDGYLASRYALPLAAVPALLTDLGGAIAIYKLHRKVADEKIRRDYDDAMKQLSQLASGVIRLNIAGAEPETSQSNTVITNEPERPFTAETMKGYI